MKKIIKELRINSKTQLNELNSLMVEIIAKIVEPIEALSFHILGIAFIENIITCPSPSI